MDLTVSRRCKNIEDLVDESGLPDAKVGLRDQIKKAILAYGGKAANYSHPRQDRQGAGPQGVRDPGLLLRPVHEAERLLRPGRRAAGRPGVPERPGGARRAARVSSGTTCRRRRSTRRSQALLKAKLEADFPGLTMRFRTSTNAEDQEDFLCAGCYDSHTGDPANWDVDRSDLQHRTATTLQRAAGDPQDLGGRLVLPHVRGALVPQHRSQERSGWRCSSTTTSPTEEANGVAVTANIFDPSGLEPGFYVNVQWGGVGRGRRAAARHHQRRVHLSTSAAATRPRPT